MPIGAGKAAAYLEAFSAAANFLDPDNGKDANLKGDFVAVGGIALLALGNTRDIADVDVAIVPVALELFETKAKADERFKNLSDGSWVFYSTKDIEVPFDFLRIGDEFVPSIGPLKAMGTGFRACLGELALMKAVKYHNMEENKDLADFRFILTKMDSTYEGFQAVEGLTVANVKILAACAEQTGQTAILRDYLAKINRGLDGSGTIYKFQG